MGTSAWRPEVLNDVTEQPDEVAVNAVGWKEHNKLFFRGKEYPL